MAQACADTIAFYVQWQKPCADISFPNYPLLTDHFPLRLTAPYSLPIVPSRDPESFFRERPPCQPLGGCAHKRSLRGCPCKRSLSRVRLDRQGQVLVHRHGSFWRTPEARARAARSFHG